MLGITWDSGSPHMKQTHLKHWYKNNFLVSADWLIGIIQDHTQLPMVAFANWPQRVLTGASLEWKECGISRVWRLKEASLAHQQTLSDVFRLKVMKDYIGTLYKSIQIDSTPGVAGVSTSTTNTDR